MIRLTLVTTSQYPYRLKVPDPPKFDITLEDSTYVVNTELTRVRDVGPYGQIDYNWENQICAFKDGVGADIYSKICTQTWHYTITPEWATTCNVNGIYRLTFAFGGWGELPFEIRECQDRDIQK